MGNEEDKPDELPSAPETLSAGSGFSLSFLHDGDQPPVEVKSQEGEGQGAYILKSLIGVGGQGQVWEAWQTSLKRIVAVKVHQAGRSERFLREALLTGELDHPSIVPVLDLGSLVGSPGGPATVAMAMKRLQGTRWDELIRRERGSANQLQTEYLVRHLAIVESVCRAVAYAHAKGVLHLDLKPSQVIVGEFGEVYLCDWGMAARMTAGGHPLEFVSPPHGPFGTPSYMAPEQALGDLESIGIPTDIYLLGGLVHHVVTGLPPHRGATLGACVAAARRNEVARFGGEVPTALDHVVTRSMASTPAERYQGVEPFRSALANAIQKVIQSEEAARICALVQSRLSTNVPLPYAELGDLEQHLDRAIALAPEHGEARGLRDQTLERHAALALDHGDLALARVVGERIHNETRRREVSLRTNDALAAAATREQQRLRARRVVVLALSALVGVLVISSGFLYAAFHRVESERGRTERALTESRRELARASLQAAQSYLDKLRPSDARDALRRVPAEWRGWEWGYLASKALPEIHLYQPRHEIFGNMAVSSNGDFVGAIRVRDGNLVLVDRTRPDTPAREYPAKPWTTVAQGFSDGILLAGTKFGNVALFSNGEQRWIVTCGQNPITHIAAMDLDKILATDSIGTLWQIENGVAKLAFHFASPVTVLSTHRGIVAVGTAEGTIWHGNSPGHLVQSQERHTAPVRAIKWHPDRNWFVTNAVDPALRQPLTDSRAIVHEAGIVAPLHVSATVEFGLTATAWSPDGKTLAMAFSNAWLHELSVEDWSVKRSSYHGVGIADDLRYTANGEHIILLSRNMVQVRETQWLGQERVFQVDSHEMGTHVFAGDTILLCGADGGVSEWATDRAPYADIRQIAPDRVSSLDAAANADVVAAAHLWGWSVGWSSQSALSRVGALPSDEVVTQVRGASDGNTMATIARTGRIQLLRRAAGELTLLRSWQAPGPLNAVALHPSGEEIIAAPQSGGLIRVTTASDKVGPVVATTDQYTAMEHGGEGNLLFAGAEEGFIDVIDGHDFSRLARLEGHSAAIRRLAVDPTGKWLVSASDDETARLWEIESRKPSGVYRGTHSGPVTSALLTPHGKRIITSGDDAIIRVFDRASEVELVAFQEHQYGILDMDLSSDGRTLISSGLDNVFRTWIALPWNQGESFFDEGPGALRPFINPRE